MICEVCCGKGWVEGQAPDITMACPACGGKGEVEVTNEEWFCSLSTKKKAEWFTERASWIVAMNQSNEPKKEWNKWLKQPHTESVTNCNE